MEQKIDGITIFGLILLFFSLTFAVVKCNADGKKTPTNNECTRKMKEICPNCIIYHISFTKAFLFFQTNQCTICASTETEDYCVSKNFNSQITISQNGLQKKSN